jgi:hypothetical protein
MPFHVNQKVVCVDASLPANPWHRKHPLVLNQIYVVHALAGPKCINIDASRRAWENCRFRPLVQRKTDISIFTKMLTPASLEPVHAAGQLSGVDK